MATDGNTATPPGGEIVKRSDRAKHMRKWYGDILHLDTDEFAIKLWTKKPKREIKVKEIHIAPTTGRKDFDKEVQKLIDSLAKILDELDERIDRWWSDETNR